MILIHFIISFSLWVGIGDNLIPSTVGINFRKNKLYYGGELSFSTKVNFTDNKFRYYRFSASFAIPLRYKLKNFYIFLKPSLDYDYMKQSSRSYSLNLSIGNGLLHDLSFKNLKFNIAIESNIVSTAYRVYESGTMKSYSTDFKFYFLTSFIRFYLIFNI